MASNLPSSFLKKDHKETIQDTNRTIEQNDEPEKKIDNAQDIRLPMAISLIALVISLASFYGAFFTEKDLTYDQKQAILSIASDLKALQNKDITLYAPVMTTISLNKSYPLAELFPEEFEIPLEFEIPIDTQLIGVSSSGQPAVFRVQEKVPISAIIDISSKKAFGNEAINLKKEMPVEMQFSSSVKIRAAYGKELNGVIDKLESLAGEPAKSS